MTHSIGNCMDKPFSPLNYLLGNSAKIRLFGTYSESALEDRSSNRHVVHIETSLRRSWDIDLPIIIKNISLSGFVFRSDADMIVGQRYLCDLPELGPRPVDVVWHKNTMTGCCFTNLLRRDMLERLLATHGETLG